MSKYAEEMSTLSEKKTEMKNRIPQNRGAAPMLRHAIIYSHRVVTTVEHGFRCWNIPTGADDVENGLQSAGQLIVMTFYVHDIHEQLPWMSCFSTTHPCTFYCSFSTLPLYCKTMHIDFPASVLVVEYWHNCKPFVGLG